MKEKEYFLINTRDELRQFASDNILYVLADANYSKIVLTNNTNYEVTGKLKDVTMMMDEQLPKTAKNFARVGRSLIINLTYLHYIWPAQGKLELLDRNMDKISLKAGEDALKILKKNVVEKRQNEKNEK